MNIYEKLTSIQFDLLDTEIKKSGKNNFGGFTYYELEDLLPPIIRLCKKYGCTLYFNFPTEMNGSCNRGQLHLVNWEDNNDRIIVEVPFAQLEKLPKMNFAQSSGTYQTYMKRYLILHTFDIVESETIDAINTETPRNTGKKTTPKKAVKKTAPKKVEKPKSLEKVIEKCNELYGEKDCDKAMLNKVSMSMAKSNEITLDERKEILTYLKSLK